LQPSVVQAFPSLQVMALPAQLPPEQESLLVQAFPSSHELELLV
jgi:hypothetical protein